VKGIKAHEGSSDVRKVFDETAIEPSMAKKATDSLDINKRWELFYNFNLGSIHLYSTFRNKVP
jgi:hypothetical protein